MFNLFKTKAIADNCISRLRRGRCHGPPLKVPVQKRASEKKYKNAFSYVALALGAFFFAAAPITPAAAQDPVMAAGDAVVTGFPGLTNIPKPQPLDGFFIDPEGPSMQILPIGISEAAYGQHLNTTAKFSVKAKDIGQVFAITLQTPADALPNTPPNIFLGASSAFGLQIVRPDDDGDGVPERLKIGHPQAEWMEGQFGTNLGGEPGTIFRVDGTTGQVEHFVTIPNNSGPGLGDVVFDKKSRQFFASDLDTGLIHRISEDGNILDAFDHGVAGRSAAGLAAMADDGSAADITNPAFDSENSDTWGLTQVERRIWGMAVNRGRLYYAVWDGPQIWSVSINEDGTFGDDARKEFDVEGTGQNYPISDMVFDARGRLYLAERGGLHSSYAYTVFAKAKDSKVIRYTRKKDGTWTTPPEDYAIGFPPDHNNASGGIDLGLSLRRNEFGYGGCDASLWSTGDALRDDPTLEEPRIVHGLQGNETSLVRPQNVPPNSAVFADYDGKFNDPQAEGHVGDVEIWQPCEGRPSYGEYIPPIIPPGTPTTPPGDEVNLKLEKIADPKECFEQFGGWMCLFTVTVTNTGTTDYVGPITVRDWVPAAPAGSWMDFHFQPVPWTCNPPTPALGSDFECTHEPVLLTPGDSVELYADLWLPLNYPNKDNHCRIRNNARIVWPAGWGDANPLDDWDTAIATIPSDECDDIPGDKSDLILEKFAQDVPCFLIGGTYKCVYLIDIFNAGPANFIGNLTVNDAVPAGTTLADWAPNPPWSCNAATGNCDLPGANIPALTNIQLFILADVPPAAGKALGCQVKNTAKITDPVGGSDENLDPTNDESSATAFLPEELCEPDDPPRTNLKIVKRVVDEACIIQPGMDWCTRWNITVTNTGPGVFTGVVEVKDIVPAGTSFSKLSPGWTCVGTTCKTNLPVVLNTNPPSADRAVLQVAVHGTKAQAKELNCKITNKAEITSPLGSPKNTNPADDSAEATQNVPQVLCDDLPPPPPPPPQNSNLRLEKKADPLVCVEQNNGWKCAWTIKVHNTGPGDFNGLVEINEMLPGEPADVSWNAGWNCAGVGGGGGAICKYPGASISSGGFLTLNLETVFSEDVVKANNCKLINTAEIAKPIGGTNQNTNPADDTSDAFATVPWHQVCDPPVEQPLCPPGFEEDDGECIEATKPCPGGWSKTPVKGKCCPPGKTWNGQICSSGSITPTPTPTPSCPQPWKLFDAYQQIPKGWQTYVVDGVNGQSWYCARPKPRPVVTCPDGWRQIRAGDRRRLERGGWNIVSKGQGRNRIWCGVPPSNPPLECTSGYKEVPASRVSIFRHQGWTVKRRVRGNQTIWCAKPGKQCRTNEVLDDGECVCKSGTSRDNYGNCVPIGGGSGGITCPAGYTKFPSANRIPKGWTRRIVRKNKQVAYCGKPGRQCRTNEVLDDGECVCKSGTSRDNYGNCVPIGGGSGGITCPAGYTKFPSANRIPKGWTRRIVRKNKQVAYCGKPGRQCRTNEVLDDGECVCKSGTSRDNYGNCVPIGGGSGGITCPAGYTKFPSANRIPKGWTRRIVRKNKQVAYCGKPPVTTPTPEARCPSGWSKFPSLGRIPKGWSRRTVRRGKSIAYCGKRPIITPTPTCAQQGKLGKWPRCYNRPSRPTPTCAQQGKLGKWPKCYNRPSRPQPQLRPTPTCAQQGKLGKWPRCYNKPTQTQPTQRPQLRRTPTCAQQGKLGKWPKCYNKPTQRPNLNQFQLR